MSQQEISLGREVIEGNDVYPWLLLAALSLITFIINVDYTAVNLALAPIASDMHTNLNTVQWVLSSYVLAWAVLVLPAGGLTTQYSKKSLCLFGLGLFMLGSLVASLATSPILLILARIIQGGAGAIYVPAVYALIYLNVPENARGKAMGLLSLGVGLGAAMGPFIGGGLITLLNWRSIFWINIPIGLIASSIIFSYKNTEILQSGSQKMNKISAILVGSSLTLILYTLNQWPFWSEQPWLYALLASCAIIAFLKFIFLQNKLPAPLVPLKLFSNKFFSGCCFGMLLEQYAFSSILIATGLYFQKELHFSALQSSLMFLFLTVAFAIIATLGGTLVDRKGVRLPVLYGLLIMAVGSILFTQLNSHMHIALFCVVLITIGIGMGLAFIGLNTGIVKSVSQAEVGVSTSVFMMMALLGNALGVTFTALGYETLSRAKLLTSVDITTIDASQLQQLFNYIANAIQDGNLDLFTQHLDNAINYGINSIMVINFIICLIAAGICRKLIK